MKELARKPRRRKVVQKVPAVRPSRELTKLYNTAKREYHRKRKELIEEGKKPIDEGQYDNFLRYIPDVVKLLKGGLNDYEEWLYSEFAPGKDS